MRLTSLIAISVALVALVACGEVRKVNYTYTKPNMTQQALLDDEQQLKKTDGVLQVMGKIDDKNTVRMVIILDADDKANGIRYLLDQGYSEVRN
jgi:hypothetical protein